MARYWYLCNKTIVKICIFYFTSIIRTLATGRLFVVKIVRNPY